MKLHSINWVYGLFLLTLNSFANDCENDFTTVTYDSIEVETINFGSYLNNSNQTIDLMMDVYVGHGNVSDSKPLIILAFGGSFITGDRTSDELVILANQFAARGYLVASVDYRLANFGDLFTANSAFKVVMSAMHDVKAAVRFFAKDAETSNEYGVDMDNFFIGGTSSGGIIALHIAYLKSEQQLTNQQQIWLEDVPNGIEGVSGNEGYCAYPKGVFNFSSGILDTSWIKDIPVFSVHSTGDNTVVFDYGNPLSGNVPISLHGGGNIQTRADNENIFSSLMQYEDSFHPSFLSQNFFNDSVRLSNITTNLVEFLNEIQSCEKVSYFEGIDFNCVPTSIKEFTQSDFKIFPNPTQGQLSLQTNGNPIRFNIYNSSGQKVKTGNSSTSINVMDLPNGFYFLEIEFENSRSVKKFIVQR